MEYTDISFKIYYRKKTRRVKRDQQLTDNNKKSTNDRFGDVLIPRFVTVLIFVFAFFLLDRRLFYLNFKTFVSLSSEFDQLILLCTLSIFFFWNCECFRGFYWTDWWNVLKENCHWIFFFLSMKNERKIFFTFG